jgi:hypothetical protein
MDADEREIYDYLSTWGKQFVSAREICRRAGGKHRASDDPDWAKPVLLRMTDKHILESDPGGRYRIKPEKKEKHKTEVSPETAEGTEPSGDENGESAAPENPDQPAENV